MKPGGLCVKFLAHALQMPLASQQQAEQGGLGKSLKESRTVFISVVSAMPSSPVQSS